MRFKLDENMPAALSVFLCGKGHEADTTAQEKLGGVSDPVLLEAAVREHRTFLTFDTDFADIRKYPPHTHCGIVVFRLDDQRWSALRRPVEQFLENLVLGTCDGTLVIVEQDRIRRRRVGTLPEVPASNEVD